MKNSKSTSKITGSALPMVLITFMVVMILVGSVFVMVGSNTRQVASQNKGIQAYYLARSGAEAAYQVLTVSNPTLIVQFRTTDVVQEEIIEFEEGEARVSVTGFNQGSRRKIRVTSIGQIKGSNATRKVILEFNSNMNNEGYGDIKWSQ